MRNNLKKYFHSVLNSEVADELTELALKSEEAIRLEYAFPNIVSYVWWLLNDAISKKIKTLYFVSREGYIIKQVADIFVRKFDLNVICKYLYCSTRSMQIPSYRLLDDSKYKQIFRGGYGVSPFVILDRVLLTEKERQNVYTDICFDMDNEHTHLSNSGRLRFAARLRASKLFRKLVMEKSSSAYENAVEYLKQEGLCDSSSFAIVSLGFDGELQKTIYNLLKSEGFNGELKGYYFGLYDFSVGHSLVTAQAFYFNQLTNPFLKSKFCKSILSSICRAPHTEVMGYAQKFGEFSPLLVKPESEEEQAYGEVENLHKELLMLTGIMVDKINKFDVSKGKVIRELKKINKQTMYMPDEKQAEAFEKIHFYSGNSEANGTPLVERLSDEEMSEYLFFRRRKSNIRNVSDEETRKFLFWGYGSLAQIKEVSHRRLIRLSLLAWDFIRLTGKHK